MKTRTALLPPPEPDYAGVTPPDMREAIRAHVVEGFNALNRLPVFTADHEAPNMQGLIGIIIADDDRLAFAAVLPKEKALAIAGRSGVDLEKFYKFAKGDEPDSLGILIFTPQGEGFVSFPLQFVPLQKPQGLGNN